MNIVIIHSVSEESATLLSEYLVGVGHKVVINRPWKTNKRDFTAFDKVINLGCSAPIFGKKGSIINNIVPVKQCIDKRLAFASFNRANVKTLEWTTEYEKIPKTWDQVAVRKDASGRKAEDLEWYLLPLEKHLIPRNAALYTRCFYGRFEYRIVVLCGKIVGRYYKSVQPNGDWEMKLQPADGFELMDEHVLRAAKVLGIDYAGFDVIAKNKNNFAILEANSGATILHESAVAFVNLLN